MHPSKRVLLSLTVAIPLLGALIGALIVGLAAHGAFAAAKTLYVGGCGAPTYSTVQAAVNAAAPGSTVYLCGTTPYAEQVIISKSLTLTGDPDAQITVPASWPSDLSVLPPQFAADGLLYPEAIVLVWGPGANVTVSNLTISGYFPAAGCGPQEFGVLAIAEATVTLKGDTVQNISDPLSSGLLGCQHGVGIQIGRMHWPGAGSSCNLGDCIEDFVGHASISGTTVRGYQKNGITIDGPGTTADISGNTVNGSRRDTYYAPIIAQNGIQVSRGAGGQVRNNTITGNSYTGTSFASSGGILLFGGCGDPLVTDVQVMKNTLINNDVGIYLNNLNDGCSDVTATQTNDKADSNTITNDAETNVGDGSCCSFPYVGYQAGVDDIGVNDKIIHNAISGAGYAPQTIVGGPFVLPIDTISFPTTAAKVHANRVS